MRVHSSHIGLLVACAPTGDPGPVDVLVVPTARPVAYLAEAARLARDLRCPMLVLCSKQSRAAAAAQAMRDSGTTGVAVTVASTPRHPLLQLPSMRPRSWRSGPYLDVANKRNVALLVATMLRRRRLLLLDDDIPGLDADEVAGVAALTGPGGPGAVGWRVLDFPDNSVACHARRSAGLEQDVFIGSGALLIDLLDGVPFFPAVYNEDWLFWHDLVVERRLGLAGEARQLAFDPFDDPARARQQEFGDVLAEGLYSLIHRGDPVAVAQVPDHWRDVLAERRDMLAVVAARVRRRGERYRRTPDGFDVERVLASLAAATQALADITADDLARFTSDWRSDLVAWSEGLRALAPAADVAEAFARLGIGEVHVVVGQEVAEGGGR